MARPKRGISRQRSTENTGKKAQSGLLREPQSLQRAATFSSPLSEVVHRSTHLDIPGRNSLSDNKQTASSPTSRQQRAHALPNQARPPAILPNPRPANPFGEAADYYGDQGQSVQAQPGVRPHTPFIQGTRPHLSAPFAQPIPPPEPNSMALTGTAAEFHGQVPSSTAPILPDNGHTAPAAPLNNPFAQPAPELPAGLAEQHHQGSETFAIQHKPQSNSSYGIGAIPLDHDLEDDALHTSSPYYDNHHINQNALPGQPSAGKPLAPAPPPQCPHGSALTPPPLVYPGVHHLALNPHYPRPSLHVNTHTQPSPHSQQSKPPYQLSPNTPLAFMHSPQSPTRRHRTPFRWLVDFLKDREGVGRYEDYSQAVGICKYCFDEGTTSAMAPRKHNYQRTLMLKRRDREQRMLRNPEGAARIEKNRYHQRNASSSSYSSLNSKGSNRFGRLQSPRGKQAMVAMPGTGGASLFQHWARNERRDSLNDASSIDGDRQGIHDLPYLHSGDDPSLSQVGTESDIDGFSNPSSKDSPAVPMSTVLSRRRRHASPHSSRSSSPRKLIDSSRSSSRSSQSQRRSKVIRPKKSGWLNFWGGEQSSRSNTSPRHSSASLSSSTSGLAYGEIYIPNEQLGAPQAQHKEDISGRLRALRESAMALAASDDKVDELRPRSSKASGQRSTVHYSAAGRSRILRPRSMLALKQSNKNASKSHLPTEKTIQDVPSVKDEDDWEDMSSDNGPLSSIAESSKTEQAPSITRERSHEDYDGLYADSPANSTSEIDGDARSFSSTSGRPGRWWWGSSRNCRRRCRMTNTSSRLSSRRSSPVSMWSMQTPSNKRRQELYPRLDEDESDGLREEREPLNAESSGEDSAGPIFQPMTEVIAVPTADPHHFDALSPHPLESWAPTGFQVRLKSNDRSKQLKAYNQDSQHRSLMNAKRSETGDCRRRLEHYSQMRSSDSEISREAVEDGGTHCEPGFYTPSDEFRSAHDGSQSLKILDSEHDESPALIRPRQVQFELTEEQERNARRKLEIEEENEQRRRQQEMEEAARGREAGIEDTNTSIPLDSYSRGVPGIIVQGYPISDKPAKGPQWTASRRLQMPGGDTNSTLLKAERAGFHSLLSSETTLMNPAKKLEDRDPHVLWTSQSNEGMTPLSEGSPHIRVGAVTVGTAAIPREHTSDLAGPRGDAGETGLPYLGRRTHVDPWSKGIAEIQDISNPPQERAPASDVVPDEDEIRTSQMQRSPTKTGLKESASADEGMGAGGVRNTFMSQPDESTEIQSQLQSRDVVRAKAEVNVRQASSRNGCGLDEQSGQQSYPRDIPDAQKPSVPAQRFLAYQSPYHSDDDRPLSPPDKVTLGAFADYEFAAALAAGTDLAGFDSNIVTDDFTFRQRGAEHSAQESNLIEPFPDVERIIPPGIPQNAEIEGQRLLDSAGKSNMDEGTDQLAHGLDDGIPEMPEAVVDDCLNQNKAKVHLFDSSQALADASPWESHKPGLSININNDRDTTNLAHDDGEKAYQGGGPEAGEEMTSNPLNTHVDDQLTSLPTHQASSAQGNDHRVHDELSDAAESLEVQHLSESDYKLREASSDSAGFEDSTTPLHVPHVDASSTADISINLEEEQPPSAGKIAAISLMKDTFSRPEVDGRASKLSIGGSEQAAEDRSDSGQLPPLNQSTRRLSASSKEIIVQGISQLLVPLSSDEHEEHHIGYKVLSKGIGIPLQSAVSETGESQDDVGATHQNDSHHEVAPSVVLEIQNVDEKEKKPGNVGESNISQEDSELQQPFKTQQDAKRRKTSDNGDDNTFLSSSMTEDSLSEQEVTPGPVSSGMTIEGENPTRSTPHSRRSSQSVQSDITVRISPSIARSPLNSQDSLDPELKGARTIEELPFANADNVLDEKPGDTKPIAFERPADGECASCGLNNGEQPERPEVSRAHSRPPIQQDGTLLPSERTHNRDQPSLIEQTELNHNDHGPLNDAEGHNATSGPSQNCGSSPTTTRPASPMNMKAASSEPIVGRPISSDLPDAEMPGAGLQADSGDNIQGELPSPSSTSEPTTAVQDEAHPNSSSGSGQGEEGPTSDTYNSLVQDFEQPKDQELGSSTNLDPKIEQTSSAEKDAVMSHNSNHEPDGKLSSDAPVLASPVKDPSPTIHGFLSPPPDTGSPVERGRNNAAEDTNNATPPRGRRLRAVSVGSQASNWSAANKAASKNISSLKFMKRGHSQSRPSIAISAAKGSGTFYEPPSATSEDSIDWERLNRLAQQSGYRSRAGTTRSRSHTISTNVDKRFSPGEVLSKLASPKKHLHAPSLSVTPPGAGYGGSCGGNKGNVSTFFNPNCLKNALSDELAVLTDNNPSSQELPLNVAGNKLGSLANHPSLNGTPSHSPSKLTARKPEITDYSQMLGQNSVVAETTPRNEDLLLSPKEISTLSPLVTVLRAQVNNLTPDSQSNATDTLNQDDGHNHGGNHMIHSSGASLLVTDQLADSVIKLTLRGSEASCDAVELAAGVPLPINDQVKKGETVARRREDNVDSHNNPELQPSQASSNYLNITVNTALPDEETLAAGVGFAEDPNSDQESHPMSQHPRPSTDYLDIAAQTPLPIGSEPADNSDSPPIMSGLPDQPDFLSPAPSASMFEPAQSAGNAEMDANWHERLWASADHYNASTYTDSPGNVSPELDERESSETSAGAATSIPPLDNVMNEASTADFPGLTAYAVSSSASALRILDTISPAPLPDDEALGDGPVLSSRVLDTSTNSADLQDIASKIPLPEDDEELEGQADIVIRELVSSQDPSNFMHSGGDVPLPNDAGFIKYAEPPCSGYHGLSQSSPERMEVAIQAHPPDTENFITSIKAPGAFQEGDDSSETLLNAEARSPGVTDRGDDISEVLDLAMNTPLPNEGAEHPNQDVTLVELCPPRASQRYADYSFIDGSSHNDDLDSSSTDVPPQSLPQFLDIAVKVPLPSDSDDYNIDVNPHTTREREIPQSPGESELIAPQAPLSTVKALNWDENDMQLTKPFRGPSGLSGLGVNMLVPINENENGVADLPSPNLHEQVTPPTSKPTHAVIDIVWRGSERSDDATALDISTCGADDSNFPQDDDQAPTINAPESSSFFSAKQHSQSVEAPPSVSKTNSEMDAMLAARLSITLPEQMEHELSTLQDYQKSELPQLLNSIARSTQALDSTVESIAPSPTRKADDGMSASSSQRSETRHSNNTSLRVSSAFSALLPKFRSVKDGKQIPYSPDDNKAESSEPGIEVQSANNGVLATFKSEDLQTSNQKAEDSQGEVSVELSGEGKRDFENEMQQEVVSPRDHDDFLRGPSGSSSRVLPYEAGAPSAEATQGSQQCTDSRRDHEHHAVPAIRRADANSKPGSMIPQLKLDTQFATKEQYDGQRPPTAVDKEGGKTPVTSVMKRRWWVPEKPTFYQQIVNTVKDTLGMAPEEKGEWIEELTTTTQEVAHDAPAETGTTSSLQLLGVSARTFGHLQGEKQTAQATPLADDKQTGRSRAGTAGNKESPKTSPTRQMTDLSFSVDKSTAASDTGNSILWDVRKLYDERQLTDHDGGHEGQVNMTPVVDIAQVFAQLSHAEGDSILLGRPEKAPLPHQDEAEIKLLKTGPSLGEDKDILPESPKNLGGIKEILNLAISTALPDDHISVTSFQGEQHASKSLSESQVFSNDSEHLRKRSDCGMFRPLPKARRALKFERLLGQLPTIPLSSLPKSQDATLEQEHLQNDPSSLVKLSDGESPADDFPSIPAAAGRILPAVYFKSTPGSLAAQGCEVVARTSLEDILARQSKADTAKKWEVNVPKRPRSDQTFSFMRNHSTSSLQGYGYVASPSSSVDVNCRNSSQSSPADRLLRRINCSSSLRARQIGGDFEKPHAAGRARAATGPPAYGTRLGNAAWPSATRLPTGAGVTVEPNPTDILTKHEVIDEGYNSPDAELENVEQISEGLGRTVSGSPLPPSRPSSIRQRQSIEKCQVLESRIEELSNQNKQLLARGYGKDKQWQENLTARRAADKTVHSRGLELQFRDLEIQRLKSQIGYYDTEYEKLKETNEGLMSQLSELTIQVSRLTSERDAIEKEYKTEKEQRQRLNKDYEQLKADNAQLSNTIEDLNERTNQAMADKTAEIQQLRDQLTVSKAKVQELQKTIAEGMKGDGVIIRDKEYFEKRCQELCQHIKSWALRFSKHSDKRVCRTTAEIHDTGIIKRFQSQCLDESSIDMFLSDRVRRRDAFMAVVSTMIWENVFNRYLFGMDREQRGKLRTLEKRLSEVGPRRAVQKWRSITISILVRHVAFEKQRKEATDSTAQDIYHTLSRLLPPPADKQAAIIESLKLLIRLAVDIAIEMRVQRAEYMMLRPFQPRRDEAGQLIDKVYFDASIMNDASPDKATSNEQLEQDQAVVRLVLFPLVVKKSNEDGEEDDEVIVSPAQVLVADEPAKDKKAMRVISSQPSLGSTTKPSVYSSMEDMR